MTSLTTIFDETCMREKASTLREQRRERERKQKPGRSPLWAYLYDVCTYVSEGRNGNFTNA